MTESTPLIRALTNIYPALAPTQITELAATVERLALRAAIAPSWVCLTLKQARVAMDLTQVQVAVHMDWSPSKVIRIETGEVGVSHNDLLALIELYRIRDPETVKRLVDETYARRRAIRQPRATPALATDATQQHVPEHDK